ncbi:MAG TPA: PocR ligand-binding domain-containing protein [Bellilinea sp.]|nr:PocR ligand-binding domain-containing protein [Bellilinea sp.]
MTNLLTARQVQEILKVDRITIYRMLQDGRLKGVKVGSQWRFTAQEVERLLSGDHSLEVIPSDSSTLFPVHCVQTIQDLLSGVSTMSAIVLDANGEPVTRWSAQMELSRLVTATDSGLEEYHNAFQAFAALPDKAFVCPAGLSAVAAPVQSNGVLAGWFLVGQVFTEPIDKLLTANLSARYGIAVNALEAAAGEVALVTREQWKQMEGWAYKAAQAVESILGERTNFMQRLQKIADLTQVG